jgi:F-type H+-transporting ATPase subunit delta
MADNNTTARPYAQAIFEVAQEKDALEELSESLDAAKELMRDGQVGRFLANPALTNDERLSFLTGIFADIVGKKSVFAGGSEHGLNFLKLLLEYGRLNVLPEIAEHFKELKAKIENTVDVTVTSASPLGKAQKKAVKSALEKRLGRNVNLMTELDENLIGGAVIRAGDVVIDGSLRARLNSLSNALIA